jgi:hypothetical protein
LAISRSIDETGEAAATTHAERRETAVSDPKTFIEQYAAIARQMVTDAGTVALQAANEMDNGTFGADAWGRSVIRLSDIALMGSVEVAQLIAACPDAPTSADTISKSVAIAPDSRFERKLSIGKPFTRIGKTTTIPNDRIALQPSVLKRGETEFKVVVRRTGLLRAHYRGTVRLVPTNPPTGTQAGAEVAVIIAL